MGRFKPDHETQLIVDRIVERKRPHKIILFGSRGRGTPRPDSDIDLCVLYQKLGVHNLKISQELYGEIFDLMRIPVDLVVYDDLIFQKRASCASCFESEIVQDGHVVYG